MFQLFSNIVKNIKFNVFFTPPKNRIVKNCPCPFLKYIPEKFSVRIDDIYFDRGIVLFWLDTKENSYICNFLFLDALASLRSILFSK